MARFKFSVIDENGYEEEFSVPGKYEVCPHCEGHGKRDHPAFENGLTQADFDEDPDFREQYMRGTYDVQCERCKGERVVLVADESLLTVEQQLALDEYHEAQAIEAQERAHERRLRSMGIEY
jgi:excinuclease UvrABC ATPase subunit